MYSVESFGHMIADRVRMTAYEEALRRSVRPGSVVADIGCGTGIFSVMACQLGARHVYAIEPSDAIQVARQFAVATGVADRITFLQDLSTRVMLPEKVDVVVSDLRGVLPTLERHFESVSHAREHLLAPGGTLIPQRDTMCVSVVDMPETYSRISECWELPWYPFRMDAVQPLITSSPRKCSVEPHHLLTAPQTWATIDYRQVTSPQVHGTVETAILRDGTGHGLAVWFDAELSDGVGFSNGPGVQPGIYGRYFFPWTHPVKLQRGDVVHIELQADLLADDYMWRWNSRVVSRADHQSELASLQQSTFYSVPLSLKNLRKRDAKYVPQLGRSGEITLAVLDDMRQGKPLADIAARLNREFPQDFPTAQAALGLVGEHALKYCD